MSNAAMKRSQALLRQRQMLMQDDRPVIASTHTLRGKRATRLMRHVDVVRKDRKYHHEVEVTLQAPTAEGLQALKDLIHAKHVHEAR